MNLFNYLMTKKGHNTSVRDDLFAYLLGKRTSKEVKTVTGTTISITDAADLPVYEDKMSKESSQDSVAYVDVGVWEQGGIDINNGTKFNTNNIVRTVNYIKVYPNTLYNISRSVYNSYMGFRFYDENKNYLGQQATDNMVETNQSDNRMNSSIRSMTMTIINTNVAYMKMFDYSNNLSTVYTISTENTPSPDYPQEVKTVKGYRNLFDKNSNNYFYTYIGQATGRINSTENHASNFRTIFIPCEPNKKYYIDKKVGASLLYMGTLNEEPQLGAYLNDYKFISSSKYALSTSNNAKYLVVEICSNSDINNGFTIEEIIDNFQITDGTKELPYVPYGTNYVYTAISNGTDTNYYTIPLNGNEIAGIGDYKDELIVDKNGHCWLNKKIPKLVLNGSESGWQDRPNYSYADRFVAGSIINTAAPHIGYSNYFEIKEVSINTYPYLDTNGNQIVVNFSQKGTTSLAQFKEWLSTHNTELYYVLATSQLIDLNYTVDLTLFEGVNNISNSDDMDMEIKYIIKNVNIDIFLFLYYYVNRKEIRKMAKLTREELLAKINERLADNSELAVELMEDVSDSMEEAPVTNEYEAKYNELLERYKQRFISPEKAEEELQGEETVDAPAEEEKVIDVEDIYEEKKEDEE